MSLTNRTLCENLLYAESEREVIDHLAAADYWDDESVWRNFGDNENNWAQIGNQQGHPVAAMVEKLVNSIDAVLMRECQVRGIPLDSPEAPQTIDLALEQFFDIKTGNLANIGATTRSELAQNIGFIATGRRNRPNYTVFDSGEGQTPGDMPDTLLSLSKSNKLRIPFVQGKFNMGGTGVLPFCGTRNFQLVISRRSGQSNQIEIALALTIFPATLVICRGDSVNRPKFTDHFQRAPQEKPLDFRNFRGERRIMILMRLPCHAAARPLTTRNVQVQTGGDSLSFVARIRRTARAIPSLLISRQAAKFCPSKAKRCGCRTATWIQAKSRIRNGAQF